MLIRELRGGKRRTVNHDASKESEDHELDIHDVQMDGFSQSNSQISLVEKAESRLETDATDSSQVRKKCKTRGRGTSVPIRESQGGKRRTPNAVSIGATKESKDRSSTSRTSACISESRSGRNSLQKVANYNESCDESDVLEYEDGWHSRSQSADESDEWEPEAVSLT